MLAYLRLFRWPNLLVVALTQYLFRYAVILPVLNFYEIDPVFTHLDFFLLVMATLLLTAAGYAINDYFDLRIDRINKPQKIILGEKNIQKACHFLSLLTQCSGCSCGGIPGYQGQSMDTGVYFSDYILTAVDVLHQV